MRLETQTVLEFLMPPQKIKLQKQLKELKNILFRACDSGLLNKLTEVNYNEEEACIISFKSLEFNEETNKYYFETVEKKTGKKSKSKSNIDRHFNR